MPDDTWLCCESCRATLYARELLHNLNVCPRCGHHGGISARRRLASMLEEDSVTEIGAELVPRDTLQFRDAVPYAERLKRAQATSCETEALVAQTGVLHGSGGIKASVASFEYGFLGGSMGSVVGERFVRAVEAACDDGLPFICATASGGARMQEGLYSLLQMGKTAAAIARLRQARLPFISILTNPTMGGVSASFAFLADIVIAEPGALIGFAGPRVIEQTIRTTLPPGFQRAEFLHDKGAIDLIVDRRQLPHMLRRVLSMLLVRCRPPTRHHAIEESES
jgi:acetyl-CoA carboxylase carboxyl transferase subunit beta